MAERREWHASGSSSFHSTESPFDSGHSYEEMRAARSLSERSEGYDYEFVPQPDTKYECPICLLILREPCQTECGHRFCRACITRWLRESEPTCRRCPADNEPITNAQLYPDNFAKREILGLSLKCPNFHRGCDAVITLGRLEEHEEQCPMAYQPCPLDCTDILLRKDIEDHIRQSCQRRKVDCEHCHESILAGIFEHHQKEECPNMMLSCQFCNLELMREQMKGHVGMDCPKAVVKCTFHIWGCSSEMERCQQAIHQQESAALHLRLLSSAFCRYCLLQGISPAALASDPSSQLSASLPLQRGDLTMGVSNLSHLMQNYSIEGMSGIATTSFPTLASHGLPLPSTAGSWPVMGAATTAPLHGGQQHLGLVHSMSTGTHVAVTVPQFVTAPGELENSLQYTSGQDAAKKDKMGQPFVSSPEFSSMKNQNAIQDESLARHDQHIVELQSKTHMLEHSNRDLKQKVRHLEEKLSYYADLEGRTCSGTFIWKVKNFARLRREAEQGETTVLHSPSFYSSLYGYKMCVRLNLNGVDAARGTHMSIFIHFMQGEFDEILNWPFTGKITLSVVDQNPVCEVRRHIVESLVAKPNLAAFQKPSTHRNHKGFGYMEFVPLHVLDSSTYVCNDILIIKAQVVSSNWQ